MTFESNDHSHDHQQDSFEMLVADAGYDQIEKGLLTIFRHFFQTFAVPEQQGWMIAFQSAYKSFPGGQAADIGVGAFSVVQAMRSARRTGFWFSNPDCPVCSAVLCTDERQLMEALVATRRGQRSRAHAHALLLCEGNDTGPFLDALNHLSQLLLEALDLKVKSPLTSQMG